MTERRFTDKEVALILPSTNAEEAVLRAIDENKLFGVSLGFGTETFEQGLQIASIRAAFGISYGF